MLRAMRRHREVLEATPGLAEARICFTAELDTITGGTPTPTRWGLLCGWNSGEAREEFLSDATRLHPFLASARESWSVSLDTVRVVQGKWRGWRPSADGVAPLAPDEPLAVMTYGKLRARYLPTFTWNNRKVVREIAGNPGLVMRIGLVDHPMVRCTFSLWRSEEDVVRFAYGGGVHDPIQRRSLDVPWGGDWLFARFRPIASSGTWGGRDPLAELHLQREPTVT
jgi:spheroidene monooxygenase